MATSLARSDLLDGPALALSESAPEQHDQRLPQRMGMPCRASTRLEGDGIGSCTDWRIRLEQGVDTHCTCKPFSCSFA